MYKKIFSLVIVSILVFSFFPIVKPQSWIEGWDYRYELKIDYTKIDEILYNFTVLVHLSDSSGIDNNDVTHIFDILGENYNGIAFTQSHETKMFYEIEYWNNTENIADIWVMIPEINNITYTYFYLYYDNEIDGSDYNNSVYCWDSDFVIVQHMNDETTSTILDSTSNDNDGIKKGANEPVEATGKIGEGQDFDGNDDYIDCGTSNTLDAVSVLTLECWVNPDALSGLQSLIRKKYAANWLDYGIYLSDDDFYMVYRTSNVIKSYTVTNIVPSGFVYLVGVYNGDKITLFVNGSSVGISTSLGGTIDDGGENLYLGNEGVGAGQLLAGVMDESRISLLNRSSAWVGASYETQNENFLYYGDSENLLSSDIMLVSILALVIALFSFFFVFITVTRRNEK